MSFLSLVFVVTLLKRSQAETPAEVVDRISVTNQSLTILTISHPDPNRMSYANFIQVINLQSGQTTPETKYDGGNENSSNNYLIDDLDSKTWYGVTFKSVAKSRNVEFVHLEYRITRTKPQLDDEELGEIVRYRRLIVSKATLRLWGEAVDKDLTNHFDIIVIASLRCDNYNISRTLFLDRSRENASVDFEVPEIEPKRIEEDLTNGLLKVTLQLEACSLLCLDTWLRARKFGRNSYRYDIRCLQIEDALFTYPLRQQKAITVTNHSITVQTWVPLTSHLATSNNATVTLVMYPLGKEIGLHLKTFEETALVDNFTIDGLNEKTWYVIEYEYQINTPIIHRHSTRSIVSTSATSDGAEVDMPQMSITVKGNNLLSISVQKPPNLIGETVIVTVLPFCGRGEQKIVLDGKTDTKELILDITDAIEKIRSSAKSSNNKTNCREICWKTETTIPAGSEEVEMLLMNQRCLDLLPLMRASDTDNQENQSTKIEMSFLLNVNVIGLFCLFTRLFDCT